MAVIIAFPTARRDRARQPDALVHGNTVLKFPGAEVAPSPEQQPVPATRARDKAKEEAHRKDMLAKKSIALNGCKKRGIKGLYETLPGFTEDAYRFALRERWGVDSAAEMTNDQLHALLLYLSSLGFKFVSRKKRKLVSHEDRVDRIRELLEERATREGTDVSWKYAVGILKKETGGTVKSIDKATPKQLDAVIAALNRNARYGKRRVR